MSRRIIGIIVALGLIGVGTVSIMRHRSTGELPTSFAARGPILRDGPVEPRLFGVRASRSRTARRITVVHTRTPRPIQRHRARRTYRRTFRTYPVTTTSTNGCTRDGLPCQLYRIRQCESGGNYRAQNRHSTASGAFQDLDSTWGHFRGYSRAMYAPRNVQDEFNIRLWNHGRGASQWNASRSCWQN